MDILALIAAFGGGIIGAYMGALPAFIMTGIYALVGGVLTAAGVGGDVAVNYLAFGSFVGPHIAFAGGVAAAGYAGRKGKLASGTDILSLPPPTCPASPSSFWRLSPVWPSARPA